MGEFWEEIWGQNGEFPGNELGKWELSGKPLNYRSSISIHEGQPLIISFEIHGRVNMNIFKSLINKFLIKKIKGESLLGKEGWSLDWKNGFYDVHELFKSIPLMMPSNVNLYLEDGSNKEVVSFFESNSLPETLKIRNGTTWPSPKKYYLPGNEKVLNALIDFSSRLASPEICAHFTIYKNDEVLLSAYDFGESPIYLAKSISEEKVKELSLRLGCSYKFCESL